MIHEEFHVTILQPVEPVFAYLADPANAPKWYQNCLEIKDVSEGPVGVGTTYVMVTKALGKHFELRYECTQFEPNRSYTVRVIAGQMSGQATFALEACNGGTRVTLSADVEAVTFFKLAEPLIARQFRRDQEANLNNLKRLLEQPVVSGC